LENYFSNFCWGYIYNRKLFSLEKINNIELKIRLGSMSGGRENQRIEEIYINKRKLVTGKYQSSGFTYSSYDFPLYGYKI